jgi:excisionase family DNA binding protein
MKSREIALMTIKNAVVLLTVLEAADALSLKPKTIRAWIGSRRIACVRLGGAVRVRASEVNRLIEKGSIPAKT